MNNSLFNSAIHKNGESNLKTLELSMAYNTGAIDNKFTIKLSKYFPLLALFQFQQKTA